MVLKVLGGTSHKLIAAFNILVAAEKFEKSPVKKQTNFSSVKELKSCNDAFIMKI